MSPYCTIIGARGESRSSAIRILRVAVFAVSAACSSPSTTANTDAAVPGHDIETYDQLCMEVRGTVTEYVAAETDWGAALAGCQPLHDLYDATVRPWIDQMIRVSDRLDCFVAERDSGVDADIGCVSRLLMSELDHHRCVACTSADLSVDQDEVRRHAAAMVAYLDHLQDRCSEMSSEYGDVAPVSWVSTLSACAEVSKSGPSCSSDGSARGGAPYDAAACE
jgi:hypothetical protein